MITVVVGKEIEKLKGEFESVINGMNMVGEISYNVYSELFDVGTECIQKAYELGKSELEKENAELKKEVEDSNEKVVHLSCNQNKDLKYKLTKAKEIILSLYNAGRDVLMCREQEEAYTQLDEAINDKRIEQFLKEYE